MFKSLKTKAKILILMLGALILSSFVSNTVFIAGSPQINTELIAKLRTQPGALFRQAGDYVAALTKGKEATASLRDRAIAQAEDTRLRSEGFQKVSAIMYTKEVPEQNLSIMNISAEARFEKRLIEFQGRQIEAWVPVETIPTPQ